jgi:hypothetical protein
MADEEGVRKLLLDRITAIGEGQTSALTLLVLAEAFAWLTAPAQPHGGPPPSR